MSSLPIIENHSSSSVAVSAINDSSVTKDVVSLDEEDIVDEKKVDEKKVDEKKVDEKKDDSKEDVEDIIHLISSVGYKIPVIRKYAYISNFIKTSLETNNEKEIPLLGCDTKILGFIVEFMNHKKGNDHALKKVDEDSSDDDDDEEEGEKKPYNYKKVVVVPLKSTLKESCKDPWDAELIERISYVDPKCRIVENQMNPDLYKVIQTCDKIDLQSLLIVACARVSLAIKGKSPDEIKKIVTLSKDDSSSSSSSSSSS